MKKPQLFTTGRILAAACLGVVVAFGASADDVALTPTDQGRINLTNGNTRNSNGLADGRSIRTGTNGGDFHFHGFTIFDTSGVAGPLNNASFDFEVAAIGTQGSPGDLEIWGVSSTAGFDTVIDNTESNNMVTDGGVLLQNLGVVTPGTQSVDVTSFANAQRVAGNSTFALMLKHSNVSFDGTPDFYQVWDSNDSPTSVTQYPELSLSTVITQPQVAPVISVTDRSPNGGVDRDLSSTLGTVTATPTLPTTTYEVQLDFSSVGGGVETIAFDVDYSRSGGTGLQYNANGNVGVTGSNNDNYVDDLEALTATATLNNAQTTYSGAVDIRLDTVFTELAGAPNVWNYLYSIASASSASGSAGTTNEFTMPAAGNIFESAHVTIDPLVFGTEIALEGLTIELALDGLPDIFSPYFYGDANGDGTVNGADANLWRANFGSTSGNWSQGDWNGDGAVNGADANLWRANFGSTSGSVEAVLEASALSAAVTSNDSQADFIYDPTTGELKVVTDGEAGIWSVNVLTDEDASSTNTPANWAFADAGDNVEWTDQSIGFFPLSDDAEFVLGTFATGLTADDFGRVLYFTTSNTSDNFGVVEVVPEPSSLALLALGGFFMSRRRRG